MKNKYINKIIYSITLVVTFTLMACLDSDNLYIILSQVSEQEPEIETLPLGDGLAIGATAPGFSLQDADGNVHELSDYAGQKVVLIFFATES